MKPNHFIEKYLPYAKKNEEETGVPALVTLAQGALESGWASHAPGNNFFGIKAGKSWTGEVQNLMTWEVENGVKVNKVQKFRKYASPIDSFRDHAVLLKKRFPNAFKYTDPVQFINAVQNEHEYSYATDPDYLRKMSTLVYTIMDEIKRNNFADDFSNLEPKGLETIPSKKKQLIPPPADEMEKVQMEQKDILGVESTVKVMKFIATAYDASAEALKDDNKISWAEIGGLAVRLFPQALSLPGALPYIDDEIIYDKVSEADAAQLVSAFDTLKNIKGDTRDAAKELLPILAELKNWGFKWFGKTPTI